LIDSTDPISIGEGLFTNEFYLNCKNILNEDGILIAQSESAFYTPHLVPNIYKKISDVFANVYMYRASIPTYPSGDWYFTFASKNKISKKEIDDNRYTKLVKDYKLKYYNRNIHKAAFCLPNFVLEMLKNR
ncbi:MAG: spermidine synthase, partial [Calditrichia bacterium]|nr:spermidine synthase [Calditrichia bacterium]